MPIPLVRGKAENSGYRIRPVAGPLRMLHRGSSTLQSSRVDRVGIWKTKEGQSMAGFPRKVVRYHRVAVRNWTGIDAGFSCAEKGYPTGEVS
ncbi:hypothetical protein BO78DRAFT_129275 [Aspergillus sclerotiicarbonarius CBS 121057]|uniref:Uncharacterized protein n=1 Tax=Aspergillus sclerotiicarbonarius (strain CBS 121057 / IBT 28362) TaxID=1448318 RepID=A0A319FGK3_ASPSB|nr:hypothetical protein BO78DRAFT_129275 [Aspergillus sclerotiicarbonarius CBS 121057]